MRIGMSKRGKLYGVGFCSTDLKGSIKSVNSHPYNVWKSILERCYCSKFILKNPTYSDVRVCDEWHDFQNFYDWYLKNYYEVSGKKMNLDKDIIDPGNKVYCPSKCAFVPQDLNLLFTDCRRSRGDYPQGVHKHKRSGKFQADIRVNGKLKYLGLFDTPEEAYRVYKNTKETYVREKAVELKDILPQKVIESLEYYTL